jgi:hypothetical protein
VYHEDEPPFETCDDGSVDTVEESKVFEQSMKSEGGNAPADPVDTASFGIFAEVSPALTDS